MLITAKRENCQRHEMLFNDTLGAQHNAWFSEWLRVSLICWLSLKDRARKAGTAVSAVRKGREAGDSQCGQAPPSAPSPA